jgi:hypothetical protein
MTIMVNVQACSDKEAAGLCNGKPFTAVLEAWGPEGKWRVPDPQDIFTFGERLAIAKAVRQSVKILGFELAHHVN